MAAVPDDASRCASCGRSVDVADAVKIVVNEDGEQHWTLLCTECSVVRCTDCGRHVDVGDVLTVREDIWTSRDLYDCVKCGEQFPEPEVVEIRHDNDPSYRKIVCDDCLKDVPIPGNMRVVREGFS